MPQFLCIIIHKNEQVVERDSGRPIQTLQSDGWVHVAAKSSH